MEIVDLPLDQLHEAPWNPNQMDPLIMARLRESISRYGLVQNLVVRTRPDASFEVLSGNQRLQLLRDLGRTTAPCVVVDLNDTHARLLAQALNRIQGEDDLGLRAELLRNVLTGMPQEEVLALLPETAQSLQALSSLGQQDMASYLEAWEKAQASRLRHLVFQLTPVQLEVVQEALKRMMPRAREKLDGSPNVRGTALYLLAKSYLGKELPDDPESDPAMSPMPPVSDGASGQGAQIWQALRDVGLSTGW
jgi:ParB family chromosome partitioning protein